MLETPSVRVVMLSEVNEEYIQGIVYSQDSSRLLLFGNGMALFKGDHGEHLLVQGKSGKWCCNCRSFQRLHQLTDCRHIIAAERILEKSAVSMQRPVIRLAILQLQ